VTDDFSLLFDLIEHSAEEVVGRAARPISPEIQKQLAKLAAGECNDEERRELLTLLEEQPDLLPALVKEIRNLRGLPKCR
jgi:hypothetical protein